MSGIIICAQAKVERELSNRAAFDEGSAADAEEAQINFSVVLDLMEKSGLIGRNCEGKIFMTKKGQQEHIRTN